jgi:hypothetical protein
MFPVILQLVPEVPVCPVEEIVRSCADAPTEKIPSNNRLLNTKRVNLNILTIINFLTVNCE